DDHKPVSMDPIHVSRLGKTPVGEDDGEYTIVVPNSVSLVRGAHHREESERLIDFLLSAETELALAKSKSRQLPLGPVDQAQLPPDVKKLIGYVSQGYDLRKLEQPRREVLAWLKTEPQ